MFSVSWLPLFKRNPFFVVTDLLFLSTIVIVSFSTVIVFIFSTVTPSIVLLTPSLENVIVVLPSIISPSNISTNCSSVYSRLSESNSYVFPSAKIVAVNFKFSVLIPICLKLDIRSL